MAAPPEVSWVAHPDIITSAIRLLVGSVIATGTALSGTLLYIWGKTDKRIGTVEDKIDSIAVSLSTLAATTTTEIAVIKATCAERHHGDLT